MALFSKLAVRREEAADHPLIRQLDGLLVDVREERQKLEAVLSSVRGDDAASVPRVLERLEHRASALADQLDAASGRTDDLRRAWADADGLHARIEALHHALDGAEARTEQTARSTAEVSNQLAGVQELVSVAQTTLSALESLVNHGHIARLLEQIPVVRNDCERVVDQQSSLAMQLGELQTSTTALMRKAMTAEDVAARAAEQSTGVAERMASLERTLAELARLEATTSDTTSQLQTLNALAEHVALKVKALESQKQTIDRALLDSRRVTEMVWEMNSQVEKLRDGSTMAAAVEDTLSRLERMHQQTAAELETANRGRLQFAATTDLQQHKSMEILQAVEGQLDRLALNRSELDTLSERLAAAQSGIADTHRQLAALSTAEQTLTVYREKLDAFTSRTDALALQIGSIEGKAPLLNTLETRLNELDAEARRATVQVESLARRRQELATLKAELEACEASYARARTLGDELRGNQQQFARFVEDAREFMRTVPAIETAIGRLKGDVADTKSHAERALSMRPRLDDFSGRLDLLTPRLQVLDDLQSRLTRLHELSGSIDEKLTTQLAREAELERAGVLYDGLSTRISDAQRRLELVEAAQSRLAVVPERVEEVQTRLTAACESLAALKVNQETVAAQEQRLTAVQETAAALFVDIAARTETLKAVQTELALAGSLKHELSEHLSEIHGIQRDAFERHREAQMLLEQLDAQWTQLDTRRADLANAERTIAVLEGRIVALDRLGEGVDAKIGAIADRERIVDAVRHEIDAIHEVARQCKGELAAIADQRTAISSVRDDIDQVTQALAATEEKLAEVERRSASVDDVRRKADAVSRVLDDVRVTLDVVGEQKATIDHVSEMLVQFEESCSEARGTIKALQAERKLAERIVEYVRTIHARAGAEIRQVS